MVQWRSVEINSVMECWTFTEINLGHHSGDENSVKSNKFACDCNKLYCAYFRAIASTNSYDVDRKN